MFPKVVIELYGAGSGSLSSRGQNNFGIMPSESSVPNT